MMRHEPMYRLFQRDMVLLVGVIAGLSLMLTLGMEGIIVGLTVIAFAAAAGFLTLRL